MYSWKNGSETLTFARSELIKYSKVMDPAVDIEIRFYDLHEIGKQDLLDGKNPQQCDAYSICISQGSGYIAASNPRSVLLGVYRMFKEAGCRFIRPGIHGEYVPRVNLTDFSLELETRADCLHRGITIEGAVSFENVLDIVDWAPKVGFNSYFIQFRDGHEFFERWYKHDVNPHKEPEEHTRERSVEYTRLIYKEISKRGMFAHGVGHGWTCESVGISAGGWHKHDLSQIAPERRELLAQVNGKRDFFEGIPLNTQLCYSNPQARQLMLDNLIEYVQQHPEVDMLHFWLGDNFNNFCECENCRDVMPADFYVKMLNEIDERLMEMNSDTKIVFLIYYELLWTPEKEKIKNPDRFIMMFAPIHRVYTRSYINSSDCAELSALPDIMPYNRNKIQFPRDCEVYLAFLTKWQEHFKGDSFVFDYHLMWDINRDFGGMRLSKVIYDDVLSFDKLELNGLISCQQNRAFFPSGFSMYVMGHTLFDKALDYNQLKEEYFSASFGDDYKLAVEYLEGVSQLFSFEYNCDLSDGNSEVKAGIEQAVLHIEQFMNNTQGISNSKEICIIKSWDILGKHALIYNEIARLLLRKLDGGYSSLKEAEDAWNEFMDRICLMEDELQPVLDFEYFNMITSGIIKKGLN